MGIGAVVPRDMDVVLDAKMGDCKDHATVMQALLASHGKAAKDRCALRSDALPAIG